MATQRKSAKKSTAKKSSRWKAARKVSTLSTRSKPRKAAAKKTPTIEAFARKIVRATTNPSPNMKLSDLYADSCTSVEPGPGDPVVGLEGLEEKNAWWQSLVEQQSWNARSTWTKGSTIAIQWDAQVKFRDGRSVQFEEVAVHEVRGGKIVAERYYYDPTVLAPPPPVVVPRPDPAPPPGTPPLDPIDV